MRLLSRVDRLLAMPASPAEASSASGGGGGDPAGAGSAVSSKEGEEESGADWVDVWPHIAQRAVTIFGEPANLKAAVSKFNAEVLQLHGELMDTAVLREFKEQHPEFNQPPAAAAADAAPATDADPLVAGSVAASEVKEETEEEVKPQTLMESLMDVWRQDSTSDASEKLNARERRARETQLEQMSGQYQHAAEVLSPGDLKRFAQLVDHQVNELASTTGDDIDRNQGYAMIHRSPAGHVMVAAGSKRPSPGQTKPILFNFSGNLTTLPGPRSYPCCRCFGKL